MLKVKCAKNFLMSEGVLESDPWATSDRDFRLSIRLPVYREWTAGQFVMLQWGTHLVGRPFAIVNWEKLPTKSSNLPRFFDLNRSVFNQESKLELWIRKLGHGTTELLNNFKKGTSVRATLPLGRGLPSIISEKGPVLFLSGGVGGASTLPLINERKKQFKNKDDLWIHGEKTIQSLDNQIHPDVIYIEQDTKQNTNINEKMLASRGEKGNSIINSGLITEFFKSQSVEKYQSMVVCGPNAMLDAVQRIIQNIKWSGGPVYLGMEEKMACGVGLCFSCTVHTKDGPRRSCLEGPWFEAKDIPEHFSLRREGAR